LAAAEKLDGSAGVVKEVNGVLEGAVVPVELVSPPTFKEVKSSLKIVVCAFATAPIHPAAISATHHFVKLKFDLRRMFFIFLVSYFFSPDADDSGHRHQNGRSTLDLSWIDSHIHNLLLLSPKATTFL
jgi:hypothetical protein